MDFYKNAFFYVEAHSSAPIWPTEVFLTILESCDIVLEGYLGEKKYFSPKKWVLGLTLRQGSQSEGQHWRPISEKLTGSTTLLFSPKVGPIGRFLGKKIWEGYISQFWENLKIVKKNMDFWIFHPSSIPEPKLAVFLHRGLKSITASYCPPKTDHFGFLRT